MSTGDTLEIGDAGQLFTPRGVANVLGIPEAAINAALTDGTIKHDVTAFTGRRAVLLFYPRSVAGIRAALRADQKTS